MHCQCGTSRSPADEVLKAGDCTPARLALPGVPFSAASAPVLPQLLREGADRQLVGRAALQLSMAALLRGAPAGVCRGASSSVLLAQHQHQLSAAGRPRGMPTGPRGISNSGSCSLKNRQGSSFSCAQLPRRAPEGARGRQAGGSNTAETAAALAQPAGCIHQKCHRCAATRRH